MRVLGSGGRSPSMACVLYCFFDGWGLVLGGSHRDRCDIFFFNVWSRLTWVVVIGSVVFVDHLFWVFD